MSSRIEAAQNRTICPVFVFLEASFQPVRPGKVDKLSGFWRETMSTDVLPAAAPSAAPALPFELGQWLGRHQALAWVANRCSAADAHALRQIREQRLYRALELSWEDFCAIHAGFSYKTADRIIDQLDEFGDSYFNLTEILKIPVPEYRALQQAIEDNHLEFDGRRIPISREQTQELLEAVRILRGRLDKAPQKPSSSDLQSRLDRVVGEVAGAIRRSQGVDRELLLLMVQDHVQRLIDTTRPSLEESDDPAE
jgi:hypothetical protein